MALKASFQASGGQTDYIFLMGRHGARQWPKSCEK